MIPDALFSICKKASYSPCKSLKKYSVPFGKLRMAERLIISQATRSTVGYYFASSFKYFSSTFFPPYERIRQLICNCRISHRFPFVVLETCAICYSDRLIFRTASRTFKTKVGDTESSSMPIRRNVSVNVVSAASSPQIPIHALF